MDAEEIAVETCPRWEDWAPTGFDRKGAGLPDRQDWLVAPVFTSDAHSLRNKANFEALANILEDEGCECEEGCYETHSFNHWANPWFEVLLVNPDCPSAVKKLGEVVAALANYPILDDELYSAHQEEECQTVWEGMSLCERMTVCDDAGIHWLQARHEEYPTDDDGHIRRYLLGW